MRLLHIPLPQLRALERGCPGLLDAITDVVREGSDPTMRVIRVATDGEPARWYIGAGPRVLVLDSSDLAAMAAAVPLFMVDLVQEIKEELAPLFDDGALDAEIAKLMPFLPAVRGRGKPS